MTLLVLWLDGCDVLYATKENMPNLHQFCGSLKEITTKARLPAISAKAMRYILLGTWDLKGSFRSLENELKTAKVIWENLPYKIAIIFFEFVQHRKSPSVFYSKNSMFFKVPNESREGCIKYSDCGDRANEEYVLEFLKNNMIKYDLIMIRDDALDAYSHFEVGADLAKRFSSKDHLIKQIIDLGIQNMIIFSDHGAFHNPDGAFFACHLPFEVVLPETFDEINQIIISSLTKLSRET